MEVCVYGQAGATYGDGHYGVCDLRNTRGCSPAGEGSTPVTEAVPFDPECHDPEPC